MKLGAFFLALQQTSVEVQYFIFMKEKIVFLYDFKPKCDVFFYTNLVKFNED